MGEWVIDHATTGTSESAVVPTAGCAVVCAWYTGALRVMWRSASRSKLTYQCEKSEVWHESVWSQSHACLPFSVWELAARPSSLEALEVSDTVTATAAPGQKLTDQRVAMLIFTKDGERIIAQVKNHKINCSSTSERQSKLLFVAVSFMQPIYSRISHTLGIITRSYDVAQIQLAHNALHHCHHTPSGDCLRTGY